MPLSPPRMIWIAVNAGFPSACVKFGCIPLLFCHQRVWAEVSQLCLICLLWGWQGQLGLFSRPPPPKPPRPPCSSLIIHIQAKASWQVRWSHSMFCDIDNTFFFPRSPLALSFSLSPTSLSLLRKKKKSETITLLQAWQCDCSEVAVQDYSPLWAPC